MSAIARAAFGLVVFSLILLAGIGAIQAQADDAADFQTEYNESFTPPNASNDYSVAKDSIGDYGSAVTVRNETGVAVNDSNYDWDRSVGNVTVLNGSADLQNESTASVTYRRQARSGMENNVLALASSGINVGVVLVFVMGVLVVVLMIRTLS